MASSPRYRRNGNIKSAVGNTSEKQTLKSASVIQFNKSAAVLATVKGKSLRDGLRPPLTAAARSGQRKLGWDEEMVAVRSNKEMVKNSSLDTNRPIQVTDRAIKGRTMLNHWLIDLIGHISGLSDAQLRQIETSLPATKALIDLLNRAQPMIEQAQSLYAEAEPLIEQAKKEWQTVGPAAQILIDVISHHVDQGRSPAEAAEAVRTALDGSIKSVAQDHWMDREISCVTVFGGTGFVGRPSPAICAGPAPRCASPHGILGGPRATASNRSPPMRTTSAP